MSTKEMSRVTENAREKFTYQHYREFICLLREAYTFTTFQEAKKVAGGNGSFVILRHDVDMDLEGAVRMSSLEKDCGVQSTYFFMVRSPLYNVFSGSGSEHVKHILADGHHFGLHFDCSLYKDIVADTISHYVSKECKLLEQFFEKPIEAISFHRPGHLELTGVPLDKWPHAYERLFLEEFEYFSDSRGRWSKGNPLESEAFFKRKNIHILIHPVWWDEMPMNGCECLTSVIQQIGNRNRLYISENCEVLNKGGLENGKLSICPKPYD